VGFRLRIILLLAFVLLGCNNIPGVKIVPRPATEIMGNPQAQGVATILPVAVSEGQPQPLASPTMTATSTPIPTPTATPLPTATSFFLQSLTTAQPPYENTLPRHGLLLISLIFFIIMLIWGIGQYFYISFAQPKGLDITTLDIKAQDGLFVGAVLSMTARRTFTFTSPFTRWSQVINFVSKTLEQELIQKAQQYANIEELEANLKVITESFFQEPVVQELWTDFGVKVIRFNIEIRFSQATKDALIRKAEAAAGGQAYLAYARAAHLDPNSPESRELYRIYQETQGQVDAARNLGGGFTNLANILGNTVKGKSANDE